MAYASGTVILDFGNPGGVYAKTTVPIQTSLLAGDNIEVWIQGNDSTADYNQYTHARVLKLNIEFGVENIVPGTSFDVVAMSSIRLKGLVAARYVRSS